MRCLQDCFDWVCVAVMLECGCFGVCDLTTPRFPATQRVVLVAMVPLWAQVVDLLVSKGYAYHGHVRKPGRPARIRRNDWFVRQGFKPSAAPEGTDVW
jgi:hypothetical protein